MFSISTAHPMVSFNVDPRCWCILLAFLLSSLFSIRPTLYCVFFVLPIKSQTLYEGQRQINVKGECTVDIQYRSTNQQLPLIIADSGVSLFELNWIQTFDVYPTVLREGVQPRFLKTRPAPFARLDPVEK